MEQDDAVVGSGDTVAGSGAGVGRQRPAGDPDAAVAREPGASVVEWGGSDTPDPFTVVFTAAQVRRYLAYPLALAAGVLGFVAMVQEWQVFHSEVFVPGPGDDESLSVGLGGSYGFGTVWMVGTLVLVAVLACALAGDHAVRRVARRVGVAVAVGLLAVLAAAAVNLSRYSGIYGGVDVQVQEGLALEVGVGVYLAAASVVLFGAAIVVAPRAAVDDADPGWRWADLVAQVRIRRERRPAWPVEGTGADRPAGPADLTVAPAEPFSRGDAG